MSQPARHIFRRRIGYFLTILAFIPAAVFGAEAEPANWLWDLVIALIVLVAAASSGALPLAAARQWQGAWRLGALLPFIVLLLWVALIILTRAIDPQSHALWPFEIFAWAMLTLIYMVGLMTAKRIFEKADLRAAEDEKLK